MIVPHITLPSYFNDGNWITFFKALIFLGLTNSKSMWSEWDKREIVVCLTMIFPRKLTLDCHVVPPHDTVLTDQQTFEERHKSQPATLVDFLT